MSNILLILGALGGAGVFTFLGNLLAQRRDAKNKEADRATESRQHSGTVASSNAETIFSAQQKLNENAFKRIDEQDAEIKDLKERLERAEVLIRGLQRQLDQVERRKAAPAKKPVAERRKQPTKKTPPARRRR